MLRLLRNKKAQSTAEYAILIGLVVTAVLGIQLYMRRGLNAQMKDAGDDVVTKISNTDWGNVNTKVVAEVNKQYEHGALESKSTQSLLSEYQTSILNKDGTTSKSVTQVTTQAAGDYQEQKY
jgi:hypothetical protein